MAPSTDFDPQKVELVLNINDPTQPEWTPPATFPRVAVDHRDIGINAAQSRADTTGRITGLAAQTGSNQTSLAPQGEVTVPLRLGSYELGLIAHLAERYATPVQFGSDAAFAWTIDQLQTDVSLEGRRLWGQLDARDGNPRVVGPIVVQAINFEFNAGEEAQLTYAPLFQSWNYFSGPGSIVGSATDPLQIVGWLNETNRALADHNVTIEVLAFSTPTLTLAAYFGGASAGAVTFELVAGLNVAGRPNLAEVIDSNGSPEGDPMGRAGNPLYVYAPSITGHAVLDEYTYTNPIDPAAVVKPTNPSMPVAAICTSLDGVPLVGLESINANIVTTWQLVSGGFWGLFPRGFARIGSTQVNGTLTKKNDSYFEEGKLRDDSRFRIEVEGRSDTLVDLGGSEGALERFKLDLADCQMSDGSTFKDFAGGNSDDTRETAFTAVSAASLGGASWRFTANSPVSDLTV